MRFLWIVFVVGCRLGFESSARLDDAHAPDTVIVTETDSASSAVDAATDAAIATTTDAAIDGGSDAQGQAVSVSFGEAPDATYRNVTMDTYLDGDPAPVDQRPLNFGAGSELRIDGSDPIRTLLRFDISQLPAGTITAASLELTVTQPDPAATITLQSVLQPWSEGSGDGVAGVVNWNIATGTTAWLTPGAGAPNSAGATVATFMPATAGLFTISLAPSVVQGWRTTNYGLVLTTSSAARTDIVSSESGTVQAPRLRVTYLP